MNCVEPIMSREETTSISRVMNINQDTIIILRRKAREKEDDKIERKIETTLLKSNLSLFN